MSELLSHDLTLTTTQVPSATFSLTQLSVRSRCHRLRVMCAALEQYTQAWLSSSIEVGLSVQHIHARSVSIVSSVDQHSHVTSSAALPHPKHRHTLLCTYAHRSSSDIPLWGHHQASRFSSGIRFSPSIRFHEQRGFRLLPKRQLASSQNIFALRRSPFHAHWMLCFASLMVVFSDIIASCFTCKTKYKMSPSSVRSEGGEEAAVQLLK